MTVLVPATPCPTDIISTIRNAKSVVNNAPKYGWDVSSYYSVGSSYPDTDQILRAVKVVLRRHETRLAANWTSVLDSSTDPASWSSWSFDVGHHDSPLVDDVERITWTQFGHLMKGTFPSPTQKQSSDSLADAADMAYGVQSVLHSPLGIGAKVIEQRPAGRHCSGKVWAGDMFLPCSNITSRPDYSVCDGPCRNGVIADLT